MIQLQGAGKRFGHKLLFEDCDWLITPRERTGLVGGNGTGKSTLLKILCGMETLDYGSLSMRQGHDHRLPAAGWAVAHRAARCLPSACRCSMSCARWKRNWRSCITAWVSWTRRVAGICRGGGARTSTSISEFRNRDGYAIEAQVGTVLDGWDSARKIGSGAPRSSRAAGRCGWRWRSCCSKNRTCCCWTSRPITWIWKRATGWNRI